MALEHSDNIEARSFVASGLAYAGLSRTAQALFQPIDRAIGNRQDLPTALNFGTGADLYRLPAYTGERLSASALMADEPEQKLDAPKIQAPSDALARPSVIRTKEDEAIWDEMQKPHKLGKHESATHIGLSTEVIAEMQKQGQASKLEFFDSKAGEALPAQPATEQVLLAQAVPEAETGVGSDGRWHFQNPRVKPGQDVAGAIKEWIWNDAANLPGDIVKAAVNGVWNTTVAAAEALNRGENANSLIPEGATMDYLSGIIHHPERYSRFGGTPLNLDSCEKAYAAFGLGQMNLPHDLVPGLIWNELLHRKPEDAAQEAKAAHGEAQSPSTSIGPGQMQIRNIEALAVKYPQLKQFGDPVKAAMDPVTAPFFVAAYVANEAENITNYNKQHSGEQGFKPIPINADTLGYRYNPDVYSDKNGDYRSLEPWEKSYRRVIGPLSESMAVCPWPSPEVLQRSHHLQKVREARSDLGRNSW